MKNIVFLYRADPFLNNFIVFVFLIFLLILGVLWISLKIKASQKNKIHSKRVDFLLKNGKRITINLMDSLVQISEIEKVFEKKVETSAFSNEVVEESEFESQVTIRFFDNGKEYFHTFLLPMRAASVRSIFIFQKTTTVIYELANPQNCIIDLDFIT